MKPFLQKLAEEIAGRFGNDPGQVCVVLPNRRAGLYLKKYLASTLKKTAWSPQTYSIEDFITFISGCQVIDQASLIFELYAVHREITGSQAQDFEVFAEWGQTLLQDFDEIDQYLVDPDKIFQYLNEARALAVWNLGEKPLTDHEKNYLSFYQSFSEYYQRLRRRLTDKNMLYRGLAYRMAAENMETLAVKFTWEKVFFAGLNALTAAEEKIIDFLIRDEKAEVFWDADKYYVDDPGQEAGEFIRKYLQKWPSKTVKWIDDQFETGKKEIRIYGIPMNMGQAMKAGQLIRMLKTGDKPPDHIALVLADEKLLLPALYALPRDAGPVNVTMGYPLKFTHLYQFVHLVFLMQENREKFENQRKDSRTGFYAKDVVNVLSHPCFFLWDETIVGQGFTAEDMAERIRRKNRVFLRPEELTAMSGEALSPLQSIMAEVFATWQSPGSAINSLQKILEMIRDRMLLNSQENSPDQQLEIEYVFQFSRIFSRCQTMMGEYPFILNLKSLRKILFQLIEATRLPFYGEPLNGLQVMGVLETRAIDFENLVVLSVNEGVLPSGRLPNSFIPFEIKLEFNLPTYRQKDSVFAYHFYRMIQRAGRVFLLYDTEGDKMKGGEKSRFITQIAYELTRYNPDITIHEELLSPQPPEAGPDQAIRVEKSPAVMQKLEEKAVKGFSPSSLNTYIGCPLRFYYQEIAGVSEAEEIEETIEARTMGTVVHQVLQRVYEPFRGKFVDPDRLLAVVPDTDPMLLEAFRDHYREGDVEHGKNHLIYKVSHFLINQLIRAEAENLKAQENPSGTLKIVSLEESLETTIRCEFHGTSRDIRIRGKADRIDEWNGAIRIIDYKTGYVDKKELEPGTWEALIDDPKMAKAFQLLVYAFLYYKQNEVEGDVIDSGNITLRKVSEGFMKVQLPGGEMINTETIQVLGDLLEALFRRMFDPEQAFIQTDDAGNCEYCPFRAICTR